MSNKLTRRQFGLAAATSVVGLTAAGRAAANACINYPDNLTLGPQCRQAVKLLYGDGTGREPSLNAFFTSNVVSLINQNKQYVDVNVRTYLDGFRDVIHAQATVLDLVRYRPTNWPAVANAPETPAKRGETLNNHLALPMLYMSNTQRDDVLLISASPSFSATLGRKTLRQIFCSTIRGKGDDGYGLTADELVWLRALKNANLFRWIANGYSPLTGNDRCCNLSTTTCTDPNPSDPESYCEMVANGLGGTECSSASDECH